jgi:hypothetical protein
MLYEDSVELICQRIFFAIRVKKLSGPPVYDMDAGVIDE